VVASPLFVSVIVRTYGWIVILSPSGALNWLLPGRFQTSLMNTEAAIVIGLMHIYLPFMVLSLNAAIYKIDKRLLSAAASLGASNWQIFRDILVPPSLPGVIAGCVFVFSISMTAFSTPVLLGGSSNKTFPYLIYQRNLLLADWHLGSALAFVLLFVTLVFVQIVTRYLRRTRLQEALG
jgi:putative spermidine/putrescine transport system permease protein